MTQIQFSVHGHPTAWARIRTGKGRFFKSKSQEQALSRVETAFAGTAAPDWQPWEGPVEIAIVCHFLAPKENWPGRECTKRPDLDNLCKLVGDALNGVAYRDDSQIVRASISKLYSPGTERTDVTLTFLPAIPKPQKQRKVKELAK